MSTAARRVRFRAGCRVLLAVMMAAPGNGCAKSPEPLVLATTTSVGNSGLLDQVLSAYGTSPVRPLLVGSGLALEMLARDDADVVISHAPAREKEALAAHPTWWYRKVLYNDFLIVGPADDPAGVKRAAGAVDAMRRVARSDARFLSRGDESGTHERERELWRLAGVTPRGERLVIAGAGMGQTLRIAGSTGAYTLTDRGTYESLRASIPLAALHEGDPLLLNTYAVIAPHRNAGGLAFARWLSEGDGRVRLQQAIDAGRVRGFTVWPAGADASHPDARPGSRAF